MSESHNQDQSLDAQDDSQFDQLLSSTLNELSVPTDLCGRLRASVRSAAGAESGVDPIELAVRESSSADPMLNVRHASNPVVSRGDASSLRNSGDSTSIRTVCPPISMILSAVAASIVLVWSGFSIVGRTPDSKQLANHCRAELDGLLESDSQWSIDPLPPTDGLRSLDWSGSPRVAGFRRVSAGSFGQRCVVWDLSLLSGRSRRQVYVIELLEPSPVDNISGPLRVIFRESGGWSFAAIRTNGRLLVVATRGDVMAYVASKQLA